MYLVDDENFKARACGMILRLLDELADIVDLAVAGGIHLDDVDVAPLICHYAVIADLARLAGRAFIA